MKNRTSPVVLSRQALEETTFKACRFLMALTNADILGAMRAAGYSTEDHLEGWKLFATVGNAPTIVNPPAPENISANAIAEITAWNRHGFRRARAVLDRKFPEVSAFIFADIGSKDPPVYALLTFLARCEALESGAHREASRESDHAALAALASRGIDDAELKHLHSLVEATRVSPKIIPVATDDGARAAAITELYLWLRDWRETARAVITNRMHLRMLGIGGKRGKKNAPAPVPSPRLAAAPRALSLVTSEARRLVPP